MAAITTVVTFVVIGWSRTMLFVTGGLAILLGGELALLAIERTRITVGGGTLTVRQPFRVDVSAPLSTIVRVVSVRIKSTGLRRLYRDLYVLVSGDGSTLAILPERNYRRQQLSSLLALLPDVERDVNPMSLRQVWRSFKVSARISARDVTLMAACYVFVFGGVGLLILGVATRPLRPG
jgi:hypothetical protein